MFHEVETGRVEPHVISLTQSKIILDWIEEYRNPPQPKVYKYGTLPWFKASLAAEGKKFTYRKWWAWRRDNLSV
jgi:hypothetical protein